MQGSLCELCVKQLLLKLKRHVLENIFKNVQKASQSMVSVNDSYMKAVEAMNGLTSASSNSQEYAKQMENITKNLASLNQVYEMDELTEPVLKPVRRVIPPAGMFDTSFIIVFFVLVILRGLLSG